MSDDRERRTMELLAQSFAETLVRLMSGDARAREAALVSTMEAIEGTRVELKALEDLHRAIESGDTEAARAAALRWALAGMGDGGAARLVGRVLQ